MNQSQRVLFEVRPVFRPGVTLTFSLLGGFFLTSFFGTFIIGIVTTLVVLTMSLLSEPDFFGVTAISFGLPIILGIGIFLFITSFLYRTHRRTVEETVYTFYESRLDYTESFWTKTHKSIMYKDIIGVEYSCSPQQERLGVGTVRLQTAGSNSMIFLSNIENYQEIVDKIQKIRHSIGS